MYKRDFLIVTISLFLKEIEILSENNIQHIPTVIAALQKPYRIHTPSLQFSNEPVKR